MRVIFLRFIVGFLAYCLGASTVGSVELVVFSADRSPGYSEAAQTVITEWQKAGAEKSDAQVLYLTDAATLDKPSLPAAKIIVTLGGAALQKVLSKDPRVPVVAALIPKGVFERILGLQPNKPPVPVLALYLEQPFARQIELLKLALPQAKKVGVLWGEESGVQAGSLLAGLQARGLDLVSGQVGGGNNLFSGLKAVLGDTDVLLAVPDPQVYNGSSISNVLLATYRARVPVMAFSPAYVRAGALMSLHSTPKQMGQQVVQMARALQQGSGAVNSQYPADYTIVLNEHVARSLGLSLDEQSLIERLRRWERRP